MNNNQIVQLSTVAYEILRSNSTENKAFQFAAYAAYDAISNQDDIEDYAMACIASEALAEHTMKGHRYAAQLTLQNLALKKSMDDKRHAQMPWEQQSQGLLRLERQDDPFSESLTNVAYESIDSDSLDQVFKEKYPDQKDLEPIKEQYARTFSAAYLAFLRASRSRYSASSKDRFQASVQKSLTFNLEDTTPYAELCAYILMSAEMNIGMAAYAILGLIALALPSLGVTAVAPVACYAIGGMMSISGFSFCLWQACTDSVETNMGACEMTNAAHA
jgi:hypothetical protein